MNKIERIAALFSQFPTIGKKTALRLVYFLLKESPTLAHKISHELQTLHEAIHPCSMCGNFTDSNPCEICSNNKRSSHQLCIVAHPQDILALESSQSYFGLYHVLGGLISPLDGIGPEQLKINKLQERIHSNNITEVILATSPTIEGETTARYIHQICKKSDVIFTRIAQGMPMGANFEYTDKNTIAYALQSRSTLE